MNILRVISSMDPASGGPCQGIRNSIPELAKIGVQNEVVCLDAPSAGFLGKDSFTVHAIGPAKGPWAFSNQLIPWLLNNFDRFDAVIAHGLWLYHSHAVKKALSGYKKKSGGKMPKFFVMPHGMLDPYFQKAEGRKLKALRNWAYWKLIESKVVNGADGVLFTCEEELRLARQPFSPYHPKRELNVGYGVPEPPAFNEVMRNAFVEKSPQLNDSQYILFLSRVHEKKGVDLLVNAYKTFIKGAEKNIFFPKLVIAGPGLETAYGTQLQQIVADEPLLKERVIFTGMLTGNEKWGAFYGCTAFILPSHQENFGIAVVEALACGKPVLISNQVNIWREIDEGKGGIIESDTVEGTLAMLEEMGRLSPAGVGTLGQAARKVYEQYFAIGPAAGKLYATLNKI